MSLWQTIFIGSAMAKTMQKMRVRDRRVSISRVTMTFVLLVFLLGGSSRAEVFAVSILRPAALVVLALVAFGMVENRRRLDGRVDWPLWMLGIWIGIACVQLIPLPVGLWKGLHGAGPITALILDVSQAGWLSYSMAPANTLNVAMALIVPLTIMVLARRLDDNGNRKVAGLIGLLAILSGILGLLQMGTANPLLYLFQKVSLGDATGVFANRNHQAVFLPVAAIAATAWAMASPMVARQHARILIGSGITALLVYGGILTLIGSRQGLLLGLFALLPIAFMIRRHVPTRLFVMAGAGAALLAAVAMALLTLSGRVTALSRLAGDAAAANRDIRWTMLPTNLEILQTAWPFGLGFGAFPKIVEIFEPDAVLRLYYLNHAHNDPLELLIDGGLLSVVLIVGFSLWWAYASWQVWKPGVSWYMRAFGQAGSAILLVLILASFVDYPLRTPLLASVAALSMVWLEVGRRGHALTSTRASRADAVAE